MVQRLLQFEHVKKLRGVQPCASLSLGKQDISMVKGDLFGGTVPLCFIRYNHSMYVLKTTLRLPHFNLLKPPSVSLTSTC
jgi:hypothetical protein